MQTKHFLESLIVTEHLEAMPCSTHFIFDSFNPYNLHFIDKKTVAHCDPSQETRIGRGEEPTQTGYGSIAYKVHTEPGPREPTYNDGKESRERMAPVLIQDLHKSCAWNASLNLLRFIINSSMQKVMPRPSKLQLQLEFSLNLQPSRWVPCPHSLPSQVNKLKNVTADFEGVTAIQGGKIYKGRRFQNKTGRQKEHVC